MAQLGHFALCLAWILALIGIVTGARAGMGKQTGWFLTCRNATILCSVTTCLSLVVLGYLFVTNDYTNQYVWQYSNRDMESIYKVSAIWGGMDGSMLLWCAMHSVSTALVAWRAPTQSKSMLSWTMVVLNISVLFFLTITVFYTNPFRFLKDDIIPPDGVGLNPLLQNPYMAVHPPFLYLGFTTLAIPYAFCLGALLSGLLSNEWIRLTRRWTLIGWGFLTIGIVLGGHWAYLELGWGGFWAWDPVENASFLPWLTATAYLHSVMVQERKDMLKFWNVILVVMTYALTVFGTFLTRSGVVQSVHAFASTDVGGVFLQYLAAVIVSTIALLWWRSKELRSARKIESFFSREAAFLLNNVVLLSICFATLWGVLFPIFSEWATGTKQTVGIPFFNAVNVPLFLLLIFLMGVGTLIAWRKASFESLRRSFLMPAFTAMGITLILMWAGITDFYPLLSYSLCWFVLMTMVIEVHRGYRAVAANRDPSSGGVTSALIRRHRTRYGGYLVHFGVLVATIGITASMAHKVEQEFNLATGQSIEVGRFKLALDSIAPVATNNYDGVRANVSVSNRVTGEMIGQLVPERRYYRISKESTSEVALRMSLREDLYLVLAGVEDDGKQAAFKVFINPLQVWLWFGGLIIVFGTIIVMIPAGVGQRVNEVQRSAAVEHTT